MTRDKKLTDSYSAAHDELYALLGSMVSHPSYVEQVKAEKDKMRRVLQLAQQLREICD